MPTTSPFSPTCAWHACIISIPSILRLSWHLHSFPVHSSLLLCLAVMRVPHSTCGLAHCTWPLSHRRTTRINSLCIRYPFYPCSSSDDADWDSSLSKTLVILYQLTWYYVLEGFESSSALLWQPQFSHDRVILCSEITWTVALSKEYLLYVLNCKFWRKWRSLTQIFVKLQCLSKEQFIISCELLCNRINVRQNETP